MNKVIVILGPTGVGKTKMSVELAKIYNGEIINADSTQIYKNLDIATAKIKEEEKENIKHHLLDIKNIDEDYTVYDYQSDCRSVIDDILKRGKTPILVGGTGLYIKASLYNYEFSDYKDVIIDKNKSNEEYYDELKRLDPNTKIHVNNRKRVIKAISYCINNNAKYSEKEKTDNMIYDAVIIGLTTPRELLYERINNRVDLMINEGLLVEAKKIYDSNIRTKAVLTPIGYKELFPYFENMESLNSCLDKIKQSSRKYAKRQYTWFNNQMDVEWFDVDFSDFFKTVKQVCEYVELNSLNDKLKHAFEKMVNDNVFPGANYTVIINNKTIKNSIGNRYNIPNEKKNDISTVYDAASLTKVIVTNTIITKMLMKGLITLDTKICDYLKRFKHYDMNVYNLLTHTSGLNPYLNKTSLQTKEDLINRIYAADLITDIGKNSKYIDINFILLGLFIESYYGESLDIVAKREVFEPLNMNDSLFNPTDIDICAKTEVTENRGLIEGVVHDEKAYYLDGVAGHAGLFTTVFDVANFITMILNDGVFNNNQFLTKEYIDLWFSPLVTYNREDDDKTYKRSIGWNVSKSGVSTSNYVSEDTITMTGFTGCQIVIDRMYKMGYVCLSNRVHPTRNNDLLRKKRKEILKIIYSYMKKKV